MQKNIKILILGGLFIFFFCSFSAKEWETRIKYHLILKDFASACHEIDLALKEYPKNRDLLREQIHVYALAGLEKEVLDCSKNYFKSFDNNFEETALLEEVAWCILEQGINNTSPATRLAALQGAGSTRDARAHLYISSAFKDRCALIRAATCKLTSQLSYTEFSPYLLQLAEFDNSASVRKAALEALGALKETRIKTLILRKLKSADVSREERHVMAKTLATLEEKSPGSCFKGLISSKDPVLRCLGAEYAVYTRLKSSQKDLMILLDDKNYNVQIDVLHALAVLWPQWSCNEKDILKIRDLSYSKDRNLSLAACWVLSLCHPQEGLKLLQEKIENYCLHDRMLAIAVACALGLKAVPLLNDVLENKNLDSFAKLNAALALLRLRKENEKAVRWIENFFETNEQSLGRMEWGPLKVYVPERLQSESSMPLEFMDIATKLEIFNLLAIMKAPFVTGALKQCLESRLWGASGIATMVLLSEGEEHESELIEKAMALARTPQLKLQAALVLAFWGKSEEAFAPLLEAYEGAGRDIKERILGALGSIGSEKTVPFLARSLNEPAASLRVQAAASLLQVLYK